MEKININKQSTILPADLTESVGQTAKLRPPVITSHPANLTVTGVQDAKFAVKATGATSYQWYQQHRHVDGWDLISNVGVFSDATTATLSLKNVNPTWNGYQFRCEVTNAAGSVTSNAATLTAIATLPPPAITMQPVNQTVSVGQEATFSIKATGAATYVWSMFDGVRHHSLLNDDSYSGMFSPTLTIKNTTVSMSKNQYFCAVFNSEVVGLNSNFATLKVLPILFTKLLTVGTQNGTVAAGTGGTVTFPIRSQKFADGNYAVTLNANIFSGLVATEDVILTDNRGTLSLKIASGMVTGSYPMKVTIGGITSNEFTLTVSRGMPIIVKQSITVGAQENNLIGIPLRSATFPVTTTNMADGNYSVTLSGKTLTAGISPLGITLTGNKGTLRLNIAASVPSGIYKMTATFGGVTSNEFTLEVAGLLQPKPFACLIVETGVNYLNLGDALVKVANGQTIRLLYNFTHKESIYINAKSFTFDLNGKILNVEAPTLAGLCVYNGGQVHLSGSGELNVVGASGAIVQGEGAKLTVTSAKAICNGPGSGAGALAGTGGELTVRGNVTTDGISNNIGVMVNEGGKVTVGGNVTTNGANNLFAMADNGGQITIDGKITGSAGSGYIHINGSHKSPDDFTYPTTKPGYITYTDGISTVWVRDGK
jgi:hypothetical protein